MRNFRLLRSGLNLETIRAELEASDLWVDMDGRPNRPQTHDVTVDASGDFINCPEGCAQIWSNADQISNPLTIVGWYGGSVVVGFALVPEAAVGAVEGTYSAWETFEFTYPGATADIIQQVTPPPSIPGTLPGLVVGLGVLADEWWEQE
jgi:hypothetical protein